MAVTAKPKTVVTLGLIVIVLFAVWIPHLNKDTRSDAFIPAKEP